MSFVEGKSIREGFVGDETLPRDNHTERIQPLPTAAGDTTNSVAPRGNERVPAINVSMLHLRGKKKKKKEGGRGTYGSPPLAFPYKGDLLPRLVRI